MGSVLAGTKQLIVSFGTSFIPVWRLLVGRLLLSGSMNVGGSESDDFLKRFGVSVGLGGRQGPVDLFLVVGSVGLDAALNLMQYATCFDKAVHHRGLVCPSLRPR